MNVCRHQYDTTYLFKKHHIPSIDDATILEVPRFDVSVGLDKYIIYAIPVQGWKHPYRFVVYENLHGQPGGSAQIELGAWRHISDLINHELGVLTDGYMEKTYGKSLKPES